MFLYFVSSTFCILYPFFRYPPVCSDTGFSTLYLQHFVSCIHSLGILLYSLIQDPVSCMLYLQHFVSCIHCSGILLNSLIQDYVLCCLQHFVSCIYFLGILLYSLIQDPVLCIFNILYPVSNIVKK